MKYTYSQKDFELAEDFVKAVLSMNSLYLKNVRDSSDASFSAEGLVPVVMAEIQFDEQKDWQTIKQELRQLYEEYKLIENDIRKNYMAEQILSVIRLGNWVFDREKQTYRELVRDLLFVDPTPASFRQLEFLKEKMSVLLQEAGYKGSFRAKLTAWRNSHLVRKEELQEILNTLQQEARERTYDLGLSCVEELAVICRPVYDVAYQGYCDFMNKTMYINGDLDYTWYDLKHLICHEIYPGHMTHMKLRQDMVRTGEIPADAALVITNTASSPVFEGLADNGAAFLGWNQTRDDEINDIYQLYKEKISDNAAFYLHEEKKSKEFVKEYLGVQLNLSDQFNESKLRFLTYSLREPFMFSYEKGNEAVKTAFYSISPHRKWEFLQYLYRNMHSVHSLAQF